MTRRTTSCSSTCHQPSQAVSLQGFTQKGVANRRHDKWHPARQGKPGQDGRAELQSINRPQGLDRLLEPNAEAAASSCLNRVRTAKTAGGASVWQPLPDTSLAYRNHLPLLSSESANRNASATGKVQKHGIRTSKTNH